MHPECPAWYDKNKSYGRDEYQKKSNWAACSYIQNVQLIKKSSAHNSNPLWTLDMARSTEKDITGFLGKSAWDKAFSDFLLFFLSACRGLWSSSSIFIETRKRYQFISHAFNCFFCQQHSAIFDVFLRSFKMRTDGFSFFLKSDCLEQSIFDIFKNAHF